MKKLKLVSIAMATYNGERYLHEQLESIYNQTYTNIEVVVCDDCSTDSTIDILEEYKNKKGLQYFQNNTNLGFVKNFEKAISLCKGEYIALADQDDIWNPNKLEQLLVIIGDNLLIHSDCKLINDDSEVISNSWRGDIKSHTSSVDFFFSNVVTGCTVLFKRDLLQKALPFPEGLLYHDWWLGICAAEVNRIVYTKETLVGYRQHITQDTGVYKESNLLDVLLLNTLKRLRKKDYPKLTAFKHQYQNLKAIVEVKEFKNSQVLSDALVYFSDYLQHIIHPKHFFIGLKYSENIRSTGNFCYLKNIIADLIG